MEQSQASRPSSLVNNVFIRSDGCRFAAYEDPFFNWNWDGSAEITFERNIVAYSSQCDSALWTGGAGNVTSNANVWWDSSSPGTLPSDAFFGHSFSAWRASGQDAQSVLADPRFVDAASSDFTLRPNSIAFELGFAPLNISDAGPRCANASHVDC
jgi:hypothetical protein